MEIIRTRTYEASLRRLTKLGATEADIHAMESDISLNPKIGDVIT